MIADKNIGLIRDSLKRNPKSSYILMHILEVSLARVNFEECWWSDPRRSKLIKLLGSEELADGAMARVWRVAQDFWKENKSPIPSTFFENFDYYEKIVEANLAKKSGEFYYVCGSERYLTWIKEKVDQARAGGRVSARRPRNEKGQLLPKQKPSTIQAEPSANQPSDSGSVSGSNTNTQKSLRSSGSVPCVTTAEGDFSFPLVSEGKVNPIAVWCREYKRKYGINYEVQKKDAGMLVGLGKDRSTEKIQMLFACYLAIDEELYRNQKHPLSLFFRDLPRINAAAQTGVSPSEEKKIQEKNEIERRILEACK